MNTHIKTILCALCLCALTVTGMTACDKTDTPADTDAPTVMETTPVTDPVETEAEETTAEETTAEETTEEETTVWLPDVSMSDLSDIMQPIFRGNTVKNETVMFLDKGDTKKLLYPIDSIVSVTNYMGTVTYREGIDYVLEDGMLKVTKNSAIPCITRARYLDVADPTLQTWFEGELHNTYWGEGRLMTDWQVCVTYTHSEEWGGFTQNCEAQTYEKLLRKLQAGEDVTIIFYGDSDSYGACSSYMSGHAPYQPSFAMLTTYALADLFDYTVHHVRLAERTDTAPIPSEDYVAGTRGTITYVNSSVGGWGTRDGANNLNTHVKPYIEEYGCDLLIIALGGNDATMPARSAANNVSMIIKRVLPMAPDTSFLILATTMPNPDSVGWFVKQDLQEAEFILMAEEYEGKGIPCAVACMTSVSLAVMERKDYRDITGNNINHPNDFTSRLYAQTMIQALIGYENMK